MKTREIVFAGTVAALYAALVLMNAGYSFGPVQFRVAEALTVLPFLFPAAIPGLFIGCMLANIMSPFLGILDVVFGSLATLLAAFLTSRCKSRWLAPLPPIIINALVIGALLAFFVPDAEATVIAFIVIGLQIGLSELIVCAGLGIPLLLALEKLRLGEKFPGR